MPKGRAERLPGFEDMSPSEKAVLEFLFESGGAAGSFPQIAREKDFAHSTISEAFYKLQDAGFVKKEQRTQDSDNDFYVLTDLAKKIGEKPGPLLENEPKGGNGCSPDQPIRNTHNLVAAVPILNSDRLPKDWKEKFIRSAPEDWSFREDCDALVGRLDGLRWRITGEKVVVRLLDPLEGEPYRVLKNRFQDVVESTLEYIDGKSPVLTLADNFEVMFDVSQQDVAIRQDPLAQVIVEHVEGLDLSDLEAAEDENGRVRFWLDKSGPDLEAGNSQFFSGELELAEDDIEFIWRQVYQRIVFDKSKWKELWSLPDRVEELEDRVGRLEEVTEGAESRTLTDEFSISSTWIHSAGHVMGWAEELDRPVCLIRYETLR